MKRNPLNDDHFPSNDSQIEALKELVYDLRDLGARVVANWEHGDLAGAVRDLATLLEEIEE